jgi:hypothetical protein
MSIRAPIASAVTPFSFVSVVFLPFLQAARISRAHIAARFGPFVVLLGKDGADEADTAFA